MNPWPRTTLLFGTLFLKLPPSYHCINEPLTKDYPSFRNTNSETSPLHITVSMNPWPRTTHLLGTLFLKLLPSYHCFNEPLTKDYPPSWNTISETSPLRITVSMNPWPRTSPLLGTLFLKLPPSYHCVHEPLTKDYPPFRNTVSETSPLRITVSMNPWSKTSPLFRVLFTWNLSLQISR